MIKSILVLLNNYFDIDGRNQIMIQDDYENPINIDRIIIVACGIVLFIIFVLFIWMIFSHISPNYNRGGSII